MHIRKLLTHHTLPVAQESEDPPKVVRVSLSLSLSLLFYVRSGRNVKATKTGWNLIEKNASHHLFIREYCSKTGLSLHSLPEALLSRVEEIYFRL